MKENTPETTGIKVCKIHTRSEMPCRICAHAEKL